MSFKATLNQKTNEQIFQGEDKVISFYLYDSSSLEPKDLTDLTIEVKLGNTDLSPASFVGAITAATFGKFDITITAAESALLAVGSQKFQVELTDLSSDIDIEVLSNNFVVEAKLF